MTENIDDEVAGIKAVLKAMEPLSPDARASVLEYVTKRLGIAVSKPVESSPIRSGSVAIETHSLITTSAPVHIKTFKEQKKPKSANEMAALVAYFLAELAPSEQRKKQINSGDIETYFKIADYPLPDIRFTLSNAKNAGYFNAVGDGEYQLNAVGHNLIAHSLPRTESSRSATRRKKKVK